jgi:hypothetical protein
VFGAGTRRGRLTIVKRGKFGAQRAGARHAGAQHTGDRRGGTQCAGDRRASDRHSAYVWALDEALSRYGGSSRRTAFFARDSNVAPRNLSRKNSARSTGFVSHNTKRMSSYEEPTRRILFGRIPEILPTPRTVIDAHNRCMAWCAAFDARGNRLVGLDVSECSTFVLDVNTRQQAFDAGARGAVSEGRSSKRSIEERNPMLNLIDKSFDARARTASLIRHAGGRYTWVLSTRALYALDSTQALDKSLTRRAVMAQRVALA